MHNGKYLVLLVCLILALVLFRYGYLFQASHSIKIEAPKAQSNASAETPETTDLKPKINQKLAQQKNAEFNTLDFISPELTLPIRQDEAIMQEISSRQFSEDAFVELYLLHGISQFCSDSDKIHEWFNSLHGQMNNQQLSIIDSIKAKCETHSKNYPIASVLSRDQIAADYTASSHLGKLIQHRRNSNQLSRAEKDDLEQAILLAAIQAQNSYVAIQSSFSYRFGRHETSGTELKVRSHDPFYLSQINQMAISHLVCRFAVSGECEPDGYLMILVCAQQPDSCGMDYMTWFLNNTLPGMRNDVELMADHITNLAH